MKGSECQTIKKEYEEYPSKYPRIKILYGAFGVCENAIKEDDKK